MTQYPEPLKYQLYQGQAGDERWTLEFDLAAPPGVAALFRPERVVPLQFGGERLDAFASPLAIPAPCPASSTPLERVGFRLYCPRHPEAEQVAPLVSQARDVLAGLEADLGSFRALARVCRLTDLSGELAALADRQQRDVARLASQLDRDREQWSARFDRAIHRIEELETRQHLARHHCQPVGLWGVLLGRLFNRSTRNTVVTP